MKHLRRLHATITLARYALSPPAISANRSERVPACNGTGPYTINPDEIAIALASIPCFADRDGSLSILFRDVSSLAAPFLLFRLKRTGFSACRVVQEERGLLMTARR